MTTQKGGLRPLVPHPNCVVEKRQSTTVETPYTLSPMPLAAALRKPQRSRIRDEWIPPVPAMASLPPTTSLPPLPTLLCPPDGRRIPRLWLSSASASKRNDLFNPYYVDRRPAILQHPRVLLQTLSSTVSLSSAAAIKHAANARG